MQTNLGRRLWGASFAVAFLAVAVVLLWSDRAGGLFDRALDVIIRTGRKVERDYNVDLIDRADVPGQTDQIAHALFWGSGMVLAGWLLRRRVPVALTALLVAGVSLAFEVAQPSLSQTRAVEPSDALANLVGVGIGAAVIAAILWMWRWWFGDDRTFHGTSLHHCDEPTAEMILPTD